MNTLLHIQTRRPRSAPPPIKSTRDVSTSPGGCDGHRDVGSYRGRLRRGVRLRHGCAQSPSLHRQRGLWHGGCRPAWTGRGQRDQCRGLLRRVRRVARWPCALRAVGVARCASTGLPSARLEGSSRASTSTTLLRSHPRVDSTSCSAITGSTSASARGQTPPAAAPGPDARRHGGAAMEPGPEALRGDVGR
jgi:hypothetical protein